MFDLIGKPLKEATAILAKAGIVYTVTIDDSNPSSQEMIVVRMDDAYHLVAMGMQLCPTQDNG